MKQERFSELLEQLRSRVGLPLSDGSSELAARYLAKPPSEKLLLIGCLHIMAIELGERRWCYIVRSEGGAVKIGVAANTRTRFSALQVASSEKLRLVCRMPGGELAEALWHQLLASENIRGEWFRGSRTEKLVEELVAVAQHLEAA